jgi:hypothetical protein
MVKFSPDQVSAIMKAEEQKQTFLQHSHKMGKTAIVKCNPDQVSVIMKAEERTLSILAPLGLT